MPELMPMANGSSTRMPRTPLTSVLLSIITFELPPKSRTVPFVAVEPTLMFPVMDDVVVVARTILSGVPPTSSLFVIVMSDEGVTTSTELLVWPMNLLASIVALQRPKFVWMAFLSRDGVLLFWIMLTARVWVMQWSEFSPEILF